MERKLRESVESNNVTDVINLLSQAIISQESVNEALKLAASKGINNIAAAVYKHAVDEDVRSCALLFAIIFKHIATVNLLLELGVDVNRKYKNCSPLFLAVERGDIQMVRLLINYGAEVDSRNLEMNWTPFMWAVHQGNTVIADMLIKNGANRFAHSLDSQQSLSPRSSSDTQFNDKLKEVKTMLEELNSKLV